MQKGGTPIKKLTALLALLALCLLAAPAAFADGVEVKYLDKDGTEQTCPSATVVTKEVTTWTDTTDAHGWYVVNSTVEIGTAADPIPVTVEGDVRLILADNASLTVNGGILVNEGNSITIYAQERGTGALTATGGIFSAGIGGGYKGSGGDVTATGGHRGPRGGGRGHPLAQPRGPAR
ncbi:MAG TPA: hypothetical protein H9795_09390 [Candidatus Fournierella merdigallinarum]|nr:hypothetical protein [Candidatus Fournierella merdigallinarum]